MTDFGSIDALLASARQEVQLPPVEERRSLREGLNLSRAQVAGVLGVSPSTVGGWEAGRDPSGEVREKYAYFLQGAQAKLHAQNNEEAAEAADAHLPEEAPTEQTPTEEALKEQGAADAGHAGVEPDDVDTLSSPQPCVLCGQPAHHEVAGFPQHLDMAGCAAAGTQAPASAVNPPAAGESRPPALPRPAPTASSGERSAPRRGAPPVKVVAVGRRVQTSSDMPDLIGRAVAEAFAKQGGDIEAVTAALIKRAIPDAMILLDETRKGARYDIIGHPWIPDILRKKTAKGADEIWEARPKWTRPELPPGRHEITALDINGAYLSALKTHLPIGQLEHSAGPGHDRRRAGVHLITPPGWEHEVERIDTAYRAVRRQNVARYLLGRLNARGGTRVELHPLNQSQVARPHQRVLEFRTLNVRRWDRIVEAWVADDDRALDDAWIDQIVDLGSQWGQYEYVSNLGFAA